ncbi:vacuolar protein sorting-associated protein 16 homolog isoform X2 [Gordionus sp. m RMFG-2023]
MCWSDMMDISNYIIAVAPFGGPIAVIRNDKKVLKFQISGLKPKIHIFSSFGKEISTINWNNGHLIHLAWSTPHPENLICIQDDGIVLVYDIFGIFKKNFCLYDILINDIKLKKALAYEITDCHIIHYSAKEVINLYKEEYHYTPDTSTYKLLSGLVLLIRNKNQVQTTNNYQILYLPNIHEPNIKIKIFCDGLNIFQSTMINKNSYIINDSHSQFLVCDLENKPVWHFFLNQDKEPFILIFKDKEPHLSIYESNGTEHKFFITNSKPFTYVKKCLVSFDSSNILFLMDNDVLWIGSLEKSFNTIRIMKLRDIDLNNDKYIENTINYSIVSEAARKILIPELCWCGNTSIAILLPNSQHLQIISWLPTKNPNSIEFPQQSININLEELVYPNNIEIFNNDNDASLYSGIKFFCEIDGCRVLTRYSNYLIHLVPKSLVEIYKIGSVSPAAFLLDSSESFYSSSKNREINFKIRRSEEYIGAILKNSNTKVNENPLSKAIITCITAALEEYDIRLQKKILKAASFGQKLLPFSYKFRNKNFLFLSNFDHKIANFFFHSCRLIRVFNLIKNPNTIGIPLTYSQFKYMCDPTINQNELSNDNESIEMFKNKTSLGVGIILERIMERKQFSVSIEIAEFMSSDYLFNNTTSYILGKWACYKAKQLQLSDIDLAKIISSKLGPTPGIPYSKIAHQALQAGRPELARLLSDFENNINDKIELLLEIGDFDRALNQICLFKNDDTPNPQILNFNIIDRVSDAELIYIIFLKAIKYSDHFLSSSPTALNKQNFLMGLILKTSIPINNIYAKFCKVVYFKPKINHQVKIGVFRMNFDLNMPLLKFFSKKEDNNKMALNLLYDSFNEMDMLQKITKLKKVKLLFTKDFNEFYAKQIDDQILLLTEFPKFKELLPANYCNLSIYDVEEYLIINKNKFSEDLRRTFKLSEKRYYWMKLNALAKINEWKEIEKFDKEKRSPLGYEPFVNICLKWRNKHEAIKYISKLPLKKKAKYYLRVGLYEEASDCAFQAKNFEDLDYILDRYGAGEDGRKLKEKIQIYKTKLLKN